MRKLLLLLVLAMAGAAAWQWWSERARSATVATTARGQGEADAGGPDEPATRASEESGEVAAVLSLRREPLAGYLQPVDAPELDGALADIAGAAGVDAFDPWLSRAAEEIAFQGAVLGEHPPESVLAFLLRSSGAPEGSVSQLLIEGAAGDESLREKALRSALESVGDGRGPLVVGLGEAVIEGEGERRRVVVLTGRRPFELEPLARQLEPGAVVRVRARTLVPISSVHASALYPDREIRELRSGLSGDQLWVEVEAGTRPGPLSVSVGADGDEGPFKLMQLELMVDEALPCSMALRFAAEEIFDNLDDAASYAFELLNRDRERLGLEDLRWDGELARVAAGHAREMRDEHYFAHLSPTTGLAHDRIAAAGYRASASAENLALNDTLGEAQESLMNSVGHRRNIIDTTMTHVGVGLARDDSAARPRWYLVQLFARKVVPIDAKAVRERVDGALDRAEEKSLGRSLAPSAELDRIAERWSKGIDLRREDVGDELRGLPDAVGREVIDEGWRGASVRVLLVGDPTELVFDEMRADPAYSHRGVALRQDDQDLRGRVLVLVIHAASE
jgi:hypothetical protein